MHLVKTENLTLSRNGKNILENINWEIKKGQTWAVTGPNGCGKSLLMQVLQGRLPYSGGSIKYQDKKLHSEISSVSFEMHQNMIEHENRQSYSRDFAGQGDDEAPTVRQLLEETADSFASSYNLNELIETTGTESILSSHPVHLSNGETRKFLITRALLKPHRILVLDEPYDGLDADARTKMTEFFRKLSDLDTLIILVTHHIDEISDNISHILYLDHGRVSMSGRRQDVLKSLEDPKSGNNDRKGLPESINHRISLRYEVSDEPVIVMKNVNVAYGSKKILDNLDWTVKRNENWVISGPNGAGKSTLLRLVSGDHLQVYSNDINLFGHRRGTGESIWDIKAKQGFLSPEFQNAYRYDTSAADTVISGFFDSAGLYRRPSDEQRETAYEWLKILDLADLSEKNFRLLSYGEKRMVLFARALVKSPEMLILDEPCQGLDHENRTRLISTISEINKKTGIQILYVSHRKDEYPDCMTHIIEFRKNGCQRGYYHVQDRLQK